MIKRYSILSLAASALCFMPMALSAHGISDTDDSHSASRVKTTWTAQALQLHFSLKEPKGEGSGYAVFATPRISTADGDTLQLGTVIFRGKRNMHYVERERHFSKNPQKGMSNRMGRRLKSSPKSSLVPSRSEVAVGDSLEYNVTVARQLAPWLWKKRAVIDIRREKDGCCSTEELKPVVLGSLKYVEPFVPKFAPVEDNTGKAGELQKSNPVLHHISEYKPYTKDRILRKEKGALYVHFDLDKSDLRHDFRGNAQTLDRIVDITRQIMADTTSSVKVIQIVGLASIEGSVKHNNELAGARGNALKRYIQQRVKVSDSLFDVANGGEAWTELRSQIEDSQFEGREEMLNIIDTEKDVNRREQRIKTLMGGKPYAYVKKNLLSDQRNSGYLRIYYDYVPDKAAKVINEATELIGKENYAEALQKLLTVKTDKRAQNALGVAYYMTGDEATAMDCFRKAAANGNEEAKENLKGLENQDKQE